MIWNSTAMRAALWGLLVLGIALFQPASLAQAESRPAPRALLLLKTTSPKGSVATFGRSATEGAASRALKEPFKKLGIQFLSTSDLTPTVGEAEAGLPLSDSAAMDMARQAGAGISVVVGIEVQSSGVIRATPLVSHHALLHLRVIDVTAGEVVFDASVRAPGYDANADQSVALSVSRAVTKVGQGLVPKLLLHWPRESNEKGTALSLMVSGADSWRPVAAILQRLAATKGVQYVHALEIQPSQVRLSVSSRQSIASLVASLRRTRIYKGSLSVSVSGNSITIRLQMSAPSAPVNHG